MRKVILSLFILCFCTCSKAQFSVALVGGPQSSSVSPDFLLLPDTVKKSASRYTGINIGLIGDIPLNRKQSLVFRTGILYSAKGSQAVQNFDTSKVDLTTGKYLMQANTTLNVNYIDVPVNFILKLKLAGKTKFILGGGATASLFYNGSTTLNTISVSKQTPNSAPNESYLGNTYTDLPVGYGNKYRIIHFSANALAGFEFGRVFLTANYSSGLTDFYKKDDQRFRYTTFGAHLGIFLGRPNMPKKSTTKKVIIKDRDHDGVPDDEDACPALPGPAQTHGCPDKDGDGVADKEDKCLTVAGTLQNRGCPVADKDHDGIPDDQDKCPDVAGPAKYHGCPVPDSDGDGVNDEEDQCPNAAGGKDNHGCPKITQAQKQKIAYAAKQIKFEFKDATLTASSYKVIDDVVEILKNNPTLNIKVEGHTSGPVKESNTLLSQQRANAVKEYFISKGISANRIMAAGLGSGKHISRDGDKRENPIDRRVELIIF